MGYTYPNFCLCAFLVPYEMLERLEPQKQTPCSLKSLNPESPFLKPEALNSTPLKIEAPELWKTFNSDPLSPSPRNSKPYRP